MSAGFFRPRRVTVLMPVHNATPHVGDAIESILRQTFQDFEFLVVDDGSTDGSEAVIRRYRDDRIRLVQNGTRRGIEYSLNLGFQLAEGTYVARMDADDVSAPDRLGRQVAFMDARPDLAACGTALKRFGTRHETFRYPTTSEEIRVRILFSSPLAHATAMIRRDALPQDTDPYDNNFPQAEDYALWAMLSETEKLANLPEVCYYYRAHPSQSTLAEGSQQRQSADAVRRRELKKLRISFTEGEFEVHSRIARHDTPHSGEFLRAAERWLLRLADANERLPRFDERALRKVLGDHWLSTCYRAGKSEPEAWNIFRRSPLQPHVEVPFWRGARFRAFSALAGVSRRRGGDDLPE